MNRRKFLYGAMSALPVGAVFEPPTPSAMPKPIDVHSVPKRFYVWVFSYVAEDYVPVGVYNAKVEAEAELARWKRPEQEYASGAVLELSWNEFMEMAVKVRLKELAEPLLALANTLTNRPV